MTRSVVPVILSGGSGTRLWPLSRAERPKQFLSLVSERTMLQETWLRLAGLSERLAAPIVVCNRDHRFLVAEQMRAIDASPSTIVLEPVGRNTAPAVAIAARLALGAAKAEGQDDAMLLVLPADHVIGDAQGFVAAVQAALGAAAHGHLVTFGIVPTRPETGYGYLLRGESGEKGDDSGAVAADEAPGTGAAWYRLERFVEKPDLATARQYVESGRYLWNSGMFVFSAERYLEELAQHRPEMAAACERAAAEAVRDSEFTRLGDAFLESPSDSIDYAVMEKTQRAAVVPLDAQWNDIGSWQALHEVLRKDEAGNVLRGQVIAEGCHGSYIAANHRMVAAIGLDGHVIVETEEAVLVMPQAAAQDVKKVVDALKAGRVGRG